MTKGKGRNPGASNLSKHFQRREHKERAQPSSRKHLGQLEKHKDHVLRAKKRRQKVERLQKIKRAAAQRNPDEFNIGMTRAVMDVASGRMKQRRRSQMPQERAADLKKTIDGNRRNVQYLEYKAHADMSRAKELLEEDGATAITATKPQNTHTVFVETEDEFKKFNPLEYFDTTKEMLQEHPAVRGKLSILKNTVLPDDVLLSGGHVAKSVAQRRRERREISQQLQRIGTDPEAREAYLERVRAKRELKQLRFSELLLDDANAHEGEKEGEEDDEEGGASSSPATSGGQSDEVSRLLQWRQDQEQKEAAAAVRRMREITQRTERGRSLSALAATVRRQNKGIEKQLRQRSDNRFKPTAQRRAR